mmetsp:Transcript_9564/g.27300  ORF Transcript_9564/g.27300 Transcript_9564/m.27300 type:complete len:342 (+) Transcript_9564:262-1287(+)
MGTCVLGLGAIHNFVGARELELMGGDPLVLATGRHAQVLRRPLVWIPLVSLLVLPHELVVLYLLFRQAEAVWLRGGARGAAAAAGNSLDLPRQVPPVVRQAVQLPARDESVHRGLRGRIEVAANDDVLADPLCLGDSTQRVHEDASLRELDVPSLGVEEDVNISQRQDAAIAFPRGLQNVAQGDVLLQVVLGEFDGSASPFPESSRPPEGRATLRQTRPWNEVPVEPQDAHFPAERLKALHLLKANHVRLCELHFPNNAPQPLLPRHDPLGDPQVELPVVLARQAVCKDVVRHHPNPRGLPASSLLRTRESLGDEFLVRPNDAPLPPALIHLDCDLTSLPP